MKALALEIFSLPTFIIIIYLLGYFTSNPKHKLKIYSYTLFIFFILAIPIVSKILSYPLIVLQNNISKKNLTEISAVFVLTGGIKKNILGTWVPSDATLSRVLIANKLAKQYSVPLVISGGKTSPNVESESFIIRDYLRLYDSIIEQSSLTTYESAINLKPFCDEFKGVILLVTDKLHSLRSYLTFKTNKCNVLTYNYSNSSTHDHSKNLQLFVPSLKSYSNINAVSYEYLALVFYLITNRINSLAFLDLMAS